MRSMQFRSALPYVPEKDWWQRPTASGAGVARRPAPAHGRAAAGSQDSAPEEAGSTNPLFLALLKNDSFPHR